MGHVIGIFDTGFGGEYVSGQLQKLQPDDTFITAHDRAHLPYGDRSEQDIIELTDAAIQPILQRCELIILACNTATTIAIPELRKRHPAMTFVGFEPMVKTTASLCRSGKIAVLATPATLKSPRYKQLKARWAPKLTVIEPDCSAWAAAIESQQFQADTAIGLAAQLADDNVDVISLACTHYLYLQEDMQRATTGRATILSPLLAVHAQVIRSLQAD